MSKLSQYIRKHWQLPEDCNSWGDLRRKIREHVLANREKIIAYANKQVDLPYLTEEQEEAIIRQVVNVVLRYVFG